MGILYIWITVCEKKEAVKWLERHQTSTITKTGTKKWVKFSFASWYTHIWQQKYTTDQSESSILYLLYMPFINPVNCNCIILKIKAQKAGFHNNTKKKESFFLTVSMENIMIYNLHISLWQRGVTLAKKNVLTPPVIQ